MKFKLHNPFLSNINKKLDLIITLFQKEVTMTADVQAAIDKLKADVAAGTTVQQSAVTLLQGLNAQLAALKNTTTDPATALALGDLSTALEANTTALSAAVVANTPAA